MRPDRRRVTGPSTSATRRATASHRSPVTGGPSRGRPTPPGSLCGTTSTGMQSSRSTGSTGCARRCSPCRPDGAAPGDVDPVWSPDGASLLVPGGVEIPVDGSTPRQLPVDDPRSQLMATYSPNGAEIAYISRDGLGVAAADGSQARVLVPGALDEDFPYWAFMASCGRPRVIGSPSCRRAESVDGEGPCDRTRRARRGEWKRGAAGRYGRGLRIQIHHVLTRG